MEKQFWEDRYTSNESTYGTAPNIFFAAQLATLRPGTLLLPAEGEGRNALYAAKAGWNVSAFDFSETAQAKAIASATNENLKIEYSIAELETVELPRNSFDAIALIYVHMAEPVRRRFVQQCIEALKPEGTIIVEVFSKEQLNFSSGGPKDVTKLYSKEEIEELFKSMHILVLDSQTIELHEGAFHNGKASVIRCVARKTI